MKVVVTRNENGRATLQSDPPSSRFLEFASNPGMAVAKIWATDSSPEIGSRESVFGQGEPTFLPKPGETRFVMLQFPPDAAIFDPEFDLAAAITEFSSLMPEMAALREQADPAMHRTDTIDYVIVIDGEVWLEVDDGEETLLRSGDVVVQNGTRHAWRNRSERCVTMAVVMVGAKRLEI